jgi:general L-amino acid transport system permease protein
MAGCNTPHRSAEVKTAAPVINGAGVQRPPLWRDVRVLRLAFQLAFLALVLGLIGWMFQNLIANIRASNLPTGYGFLDQPTRFDIVDASFDPGQPVRDALVIGLINTLRVCLVGIALATAFGIVLGVARLSTNWLVRTAARLYVEFFRNVPVLLIILFMYTAVLLRLPRLTEATEWLGAVVLSNQQLWIPWVQGAEANGSAGTFLLLTGAGLVLGVGVRMWRQRRFDQTGQPAHGFMWGVGAFLLAVALAYIALSAPVTLSLPTRSDRLVSGGIAMSALYAALLSGLVIYTASHIAEIVRGSILAVPKGQSEAANALALSNFQRLRHVVLPQASRIMIPPLANQYLNLTKNSSLGVAIGYVELTMVTQTVIANGNPSPQAISTNMAVYLAISLVIALGANLVNRRLRLEAA